MPAPIGPHRSCATRWCSRWPVARSIAMPSGWRIQAGATSVRNRAMPKLTGTAMIIAMMVLTTVP